MDLTILQVELTLKELRGAAAIQYLYDHGHPIFEALQIAYDLNLITTNHFKTLLTYPQHVSTITHVEISDYRIKVCWDDGYHIEWSPI